MRRSQGHKLEALERHEKLQVRAAAALASRIYPGPIGELISRELLTWDDFGYRFGSGSLIARVVEHLLKASPDQVA